MRTAVAIAYPGLLIGIVQDQEVPSGISRMVFTDGGGRY
jgi:hypothetical protein